MNTRIKIIFTGFLILFFCFPVQAQNDVAQKEISLTVSVTGERGKYVGGLKAENFQVTVEKKLKEIASFDELKDAPATIVFLIDVSASQDGLIAPFAKQVWQFIKRANPKNEYVLIAFNNKVELITEKTEDRKMLEDGLNRISETAPQGNTSFNKAVYAGIERAETGKYQKKVLIACSDGFDNSYPKFKLRGVTEYLKRSEVLFYSLSFRGEVNQDDSSAVIAEGRETLYKLSEVSGGLALFPPTFTEIAENFEQIAAELKNQYRITFRVGSDTTNADKWHEIKIMAAVISGDNRKIRFSARTRTGFYPTATK